MFVKISADAKASLEDAENFRAFKVVSEAGAVPPAAALAGIGRLEDGHVWIDQKWLIGQGPDRPAWREDFAKMTAYAEKSGWVDATGAIRAHIEAI